MNDFCTVLSSADAESIQMRFKLLWFLDRCRVTKVEARVPEPEPRLWFDVHGGLSKEDYGRLELFHNVAELLLIDTTALRKHHPTAVFQALTAQPKPYALLLSQKLILRHTSYGIPNRQVHGPCSGETIQTGLNCVGMQRQLPLLKGTESAYKQRITSELEKMDGAVAGALLEPRIRECKCPTLDKYVQQAHAYCKYFYLKHGVEQCLSLQVLVTT